MSKRTSKLTVSLRFAPSDDLRRILADHYRHCHNRRLRESAAYRSMYEPADMTFRQMITATRAM